MQLQSHDYRRSSETRSTTVAGTIGAVVVLTTMGLGIGGGMSSAAAQNAEVAYVEAVSGRVIALTRGSPTLLDALDIVGDRTRLDLQPNSELRICHNRTQQLVTLKGPSRATVSAEGVTVESGKAAGVSAETCAAPTVSKLQGGLLSRGVSAKQ